MSRRKRPRFCHLECAGSQKERQIDELLAPLHRQKDVAPFYAA